MAKMPMSNLQRYRMNKYDLDLHVFVYLNWLFWFVVSLNKWLSHFLFIRNLEKSTEINTFEQDFEPDKRGKRLNEIQVLRVP